MSFPLRVFELPGKGRGCAATKPLAAGEVVLRCAPIAIALDDAELATRCNRCTKVLEDPEKSKECKLCEVARFCESCENDAATSKDHEGECWALSVLHNHRNQGIRKCLLGKRGLTDQGTTETRLAVRLLTVRARHRKGQEPLPLLDPTADDPDSPPVAHDVWPDVEELDPIEDQHLDDALARLPEDAAEGLQGGANMVALLAPNMARCHRDEVLRLLLRIKSNSMALTPEHRVRAATATDAAVSWKDFGTGLYPCGAMFNHSCEPNCLWFVDQGVLAVETTKSLEEGTELTIPYIPVSRNCDNETSGRRARLKKEFGFTCMCQRCSQKKPLLEPASSENPPQSRARLTTPRRRRSRPRAPSKQIAVPDTKRPKKVSHKQVGRSTQDMSDSLCHETEVVIPRSRSGRLLRPSKRSVSHSGCTFRCRAPARKRQRRLAKINAAVARAHSSSAVESGKMRRQRRIRGKTTILDGKCAVSPLSAKRKPAIPAPKCNVGSVRKFGSMLAPTPTSPKLTETKATVKTIRWRRLVLSTRSEPSKKKRLAAPVSASLETKGRVGKSSRAENIATMKAAVALNHVKSKAKRTKSSSTGINKRSSEEEVKSKPIVRRRPAAAHVPRF